MPFEVVPGIPAGIGAASYAGVPLTYPGGGDTLTFVRGHEDDGKTRAVDRLGEPGAARRHDRLLRRAGAAAADAAGAPRRTAGRRKIGGAHLRRHAADAGDDARDARRDRARRRSSRRIGGPRSSSSAASPRCASTCAGSTRGRCSASGCSSRGRASRPPRWCELLEAHGRRSDRGADDPHRAARRLRPARRGVRRDRRSSTGSCSPAPTPSTCSSSACWRRRCDLRALNGVNLCAVGPATAERLRELRPEGRPRAGRVPRRSARRRRSPARATSPACGSCCRAPTSAARSSPTSCAGAAPRSPKWSPTGR